MSLICIAVLHLGNSNINKRKKLGDKFLEQHSAIVNFYFISSILDILVQNKEIEQKNPKKSHIFRHNRVALLPQTLLVSFVILEKLIIIYSYYQCRNSTL